MISCTCWDYSEGHLCKHCHKVWNSYYTSGEQQQLFLNDDLPLDHDEFGYNPEENKELKTGI
jgi:hypothetical protein